MVETTIFLHYFVFCQNAEVHPYQLYLYEPQIPDSEMAPAEKLVKSKVEECMPVSGKLPKCLHPS
jgi:hypothetical protein